MAWEKINSEKQLVDVMNLSDQHPVVLFKHSPRCPISALALSKFENAFRQQDFFIVDVVNNREFSQQVATDLGVNHQSPQLLIISKQHCVAHFSHMEISASQTTEILNSLENN